MSGRSGQTDDDAVDGLAGSWTVSSDETPSWLPIVHDMALAPGVYQARAQLREPGSGRVGTVTHRFEVPEPRVLRLCTPVVSDSLETDRRGKPKLRPTAQRSFWLSATPHLFVQFADEGARDENDVTARAGLHDEMGRAVRDVPRESMPAAGGRLTRMLGMAWMASRPAPTSCESTPGSRAPVRNASIGSGSC